jgi:hypothetical protein
MRVETEFHRRETPRWALWLVTVVCFGPVTLIWLLGVLLTPIWIAMLAALIAEPERFAHDASATSWIVALPIALVIGGLIGLIGIVRVLTLSRHERPKSHRLFTIGMVAVGLVTLLSFDWPLVGPEFSDFADLVSVGGLIYTLLPFAGAAWLLAKSWRLLLAGSARQGVESGSSRLRRERRDDWRLDA